MTAKKWCVPDCYYPETTSGGRYPSHESICVLNMGAEDAEIKITLYFEDREPMTGLSAVCGARRTNHIRMDKIKSVSGGTIPRGVPYAALIESDREVAVQYSRCDTTQAALSFLSAVAVTL